MTQPDDISVEGGDEDVGLDPSQVNVARKSDADEADLIEQATVVPVPDEEFDR